MPVLSTLFTHCLGRRSSGSKSGFDSYYHFNSEKLGYSFQNQYHDDDNDDNVTDKHEYNHKEWFNLLDVLYDSFIFFDLHDDGRTIGGYKDGKDGEDDEIDENDKDGNVNQAADEIVAALLSANETEPRCPELQKAVDDIVVAYQVGDGNMNEYENENKNSGNGNGNGNGNGDVNSLKIKMQKNNITRKWIRTLARAIMHRLQKIVARLLVAVNDHDMPKMGKTMHHAFQRALAEAQVTLKDWRHLPRDHPVWCTLVVLGMLVPLAPWALEALGFAEMGIVEGVHSLSLSLCLFLYFFLLTFLSIMTNLTTGSLAARWQSTFGGYVSSDSLFAFFQRLGMVWRRASKGKMGKSRIIH